MTTEATVTREQLEAGIAAARTDLDTAQARAAEIVAALMKEQPLDFIKLGAASAPVEAAQGRFNKASQSLEDFVKASRWEQSAALRQPVLDAIHARFISDKPVTSVQSARGRILIAEDGSVTSTIVVQVRAIDIDTLNAMIVAEVDGKALLAQGITSIDVDVKDADKPSATVSLLPTSASGKAVSTPKSDGEARQGALEYQYGNEWLSARGLLDALQAENHAFFVKRQASKAWGGGNGMSNMAKDAAKDLNLPSRAKAAVA